MSPEERLNAETLLLNVSCDRSGMDFAGSLQRSYFLMNFLNFLHSYPFYEFTALLVLAAMVGFIGILFKQPMIVTFIAAGVLSGPAALGIVTSYENIELLAKLGVSLLLFLVGLKLDINLIRSLGPVALATGLGQVLFTSVLGYLIAISLGYESLTSIYIGIALTFSSTIIIIKLLSDKKEVNSLHGKIAVGFLIVQDIVVVLAMMILSTLGMTTTQGPDQGLFQLLKAMLTGILLLGTVWCFSRFIANPLMRRVARSSELILIFALSWASFLAALGNILGFGIELGGLIAGISLASTPYREAMVTRLSSLRDFLLLFFFIDLGSRLEIQDFGTQIFPALILSLFVLIGNPVIVMVIMGVLGYRKKTSFLAGLTVAQISEFSLIFISMGLSLGHLQEETLGLVTLVGLMTIALSVYMITYSHNLFQRFERYLNVFERSQTQRETTHKRLTEEMEKFDVIIFGLGRFGKAIAEQLVQKNLTVLGIDFNPEVVRNWKLKGSMVQYGDALDQDFFETLPLKDTKWIISALPEHETGLTHSDPKFMLLDVLKRQNFKGKIGLSTYSPELFKTLKKKGADEVFMPYEDEALMIAERITISYSEEFLH